MMVKLSLLHGLMLIFLVGCGSPTPPSPAPRIVQVMKVGSSTVKHTQSFPGRLRAVDRAELSFEVSGVVQKVAVDLGDSFQAGQTLAELDDAQARARVTAAAAALEEARAELVNAKADAKRFLELKDSGAVSTSSVETAVTRQDQAEQSVRRLAAELIREEETLRDHALIAPYAGTVSNRSVEPASVVTAGELVMEISGEGAGVEALVNISEVARRTAEVGQAAVVHLPATGESYPGTISEVAGAAGNAGLVPAVVFVQDGSDLTPGTPVEVELIDPEVPKGYLLPLGSYAAGPDNSVTVFQVQADNSLQAKSVPVIKFTDAGVVITSGLSPADEIVAKGASRLRDAEKVQPVRQELKRYDE